MARIPAGELGTRSGNVAVSAVMVTSPAPKPGESDELTNAELIGVLSDGDSDGPAGATAATTAAAATTTAGKKKAKKKSASPLPEWKTPGALLTKEEAAAAKAAKAAKIKQDAAAGKVSVV